MFVFFLDIFLIFFCICLFFVKTLISLSAFSPFVSPVPYILLPLSCQTTLFSYLSLLFFSLFFLFLESRNAKKCFMNFLSFFLSFNLFSYLFGWVSVVVNLQFESPDSRCICFYFEMTVIVVFFLLKSFLSSS
jgi:hypothetical protein